MSADRVTRTEVIAAIWMGVVIVAALAGPVLGLASPTAQGRCTTRQPVKQVEASGKPVIRDGLYLLRAQDGCSFQAAADDRPAARPSGRHLLGNDQIGRDLLARLVAGARTTVLIAFGSVTIGLLVGGPIGMVAGYFGRLVDPLVTGVCLVILAIPGLILPISLIAAFGRTAFAVWLALSIAAVPLVALMTRAQVQAIASRDFVLAARIAGATHGRILRTEILPNIAPFALVFFGLGAAGAIVTEGGLAMIGLSVSGATTSWGSLIGDGRPLLETDPHICLIPTAVMFLTILATTRLCDGLAGRLGLDRTSLL